MSSDSLRRCMAAGLSAAIVGASLAGCGGGLKSNKPAEQIYVLKPAVAAAATASVATAMLVVARPTVQPGLDTSNIALTRAGNRLDYFAGSRWGASLSQVVGALAVESLFASGKFASVTDDTHGASGAGFELVLTVRHFEAQYAADDEAPMARVDFECMLIARPPRTTVGRCDSQASVPASGNRMAAIVAALETAAQRALGDVAQKAADLAATRSPAPR